MAGVLGFVIVTMFWPGMAGAGVASKWVALQVLLPLTLCFVQVRVTAVHLVMAAIFAWALVSLAWVEVLPDGIEGLSFLGVIALSFLVGHDINIDCLLRGMGLGLWISSAVAILQWFGIYPVTSAGDGGPSTGLFVNSIFLGEISAAVLLGLIAQSSWIIALGVIPGLLLSGARGAVLAAGIAFIAWCVPRIRERTLIIVPVLTMLLLAVEPDKWLYSQTWATRLTFWRDTIEGLTWRGHGIGSFVSMFPAYGDGIDLVSIQPTHAHNDFLELAFELGLPGVILGALLVGMVLWRARERERLVLLTLGITALFGFPLHMACTAFLFGAVAGHAAGGWDRVRIGTLFGRSGVYEGRQFADLGGFAAGGEALPL
jgi:hypothetical protein